IKKIISRHGSLNLCFVAGLNRNDKTIIEALVKFVGKLNCSDRYLIPLPEKRGACKRLNLFLRWMVRKDAVDPGGWETVPKRKLIVPIDTHMARIGRMLGATMRKTADMKMALEITETFKKLAPRDPVKYDFALTRFGIRNDLQITALQREMNG
ncbi:MAG: TIGR02757 family protein, partial [Desulfobacterales bacterium]|nr:TIGR02757 family protein [Desulfobacterales bacterium]